MFSFVTVVVKNQYFCIREFMYCLSLSKEYTSSSVLLVSSAIALAIHLIFLPSLKVIFTVSSNTSPEAIFLNISFAGIS